MILSDTFELRIGGKLVGPTFDLDEDDAHAWVARRHPGKAYSVTTISDGKLHSVVDYQAR